MKSVLPILRTKILNLTSSATKYYIIFAKDGPRGHSVFKVQVRHSHYPETNVNYCSGETSHSSKSDLYPGSNKDVRAFLEWGHGNHYCFSKVELLQNVSYEHDKSFKLKQLLDQLQQHDKDFVSEDFNSDELLTVDDDDSVMGCVMTEKEILQEICENETVEEEEEDGEDCDNENEIVNFSTLTESDEIGVITLKASSLIQMQLNAPCDRQQLWTFSKSSRKRSYL